MCIMSSRDEQVDCIWTPVLLNEIKEGFNQLAFSSRLRLHCTSQEEVVITFTRGYRTVGANVHSLTEIQRVRKLWWAQRSLS